MNGIEKVKPTGHAHPHTHTTWQRKQKKMCDIYKLWNMRKYFKCYLIQQRGKG